MGNDQEAPPLRIVIVDDDEDSANTLVALLRAMGQHAWPAYDGPSGISLVHGCKPHLVLLDIVMPDMTGFEILTAIRGTPELKDTRVIALTGLGGPGDVHATLARGFDGHIVKPASSEILAEMLRRSKPSGGGGIGPPLPASPLVSL